MRKKLAGGSELRDEASREKPPSVRRRTKLLLYQCANASGEDVNCARLIFMGKVPVYEAVAKELLEMCGI